MKNFRQFDQCLKVFPEQFCSKSHSKCDSGVHSFKNNIQKYKIILDFLYNNQLITFFSMNFQLYLLLFGISFFYCCKAQELTLQVQNLKTGARAQAFCDNYSVEYGATNIYITISARGTFSITDNREDSVYINVEFYHPGMEACIQRRSTTLTSSGTLTALRTCVIPGPIYYTESLSVAAIATSYKGAYAYDTAYFTLKVGPKPPGPNPDNDSNNLGLILGLSIPGGIIFLIVCYCCCKKNKKQKDGQKLLLNQHQQSLQKYSQKGYERVRTMNFILVNSRKCCVNFKQEEPIFDIYRQACQAAHLNPMDHCLLVGKLTYFPYRYRNMKTDIFLQSNQPIYLLPNFLTCNRHAKQLQILVQQNKQLRVLDPGLNFEVQCLNKDCQIYAKSYWLNRGYGILYLNEEIQKSKCICCGYYLTNFKNIGFCLSKVNMNGMLLIGNKEVVFEKIEIVCSDQQNVVTFSKVFSCGLNFIYFRFIVEYA